MTIEKEIKYYERNLEKVISAYKGDWRKEKYIKYAEMKLEEAKKKLKHCNKTRL